MMISKIISGGQTGADRAALDFAIKMDIPHGGWVPKGRLAEDGPLPPKYNLKEMPTKSYSKRTEQNVIDSDGTLILSHGKLTGGSKLTQELTDKHKRPSLHIDFNNMIEYEAAVHTNDWMGQNEIQVLNVAGPRASKDPKIYARVLITLEIAYYVHRSTERFKITRQAAVTKTVNEAVDLLITIMPLRDRAIISGMKEFDLVGLHDSLGEYIRNEFALLSGNTSLLDDCRKLSGITFMNPDDAVAFIIQALRDRLQKTHKIRVIK